MTYKGTNNVVDFSPENGRDVVEALTKAVVGDSILRKIVGTNLLCTLTRPHLRPPVLVLLLLLLMFNHV
jgi:hypothetical protein